MLISSLYQRLQIMEQAISPGKNSIFYDITNLFCYWSMQKTESCFKLCLKSLNIQFKTGSLPSCLLFLLVHPLSLFMLGWFTSQKNFECWRNNAKIDDTSEGKENREKSIHDGERWKWSSGWREQRQIIKTQIWTCFSMKTSQKHQSKRKWVQL